VSEPSAASADSRIHRIAVAAGIGLVCAQLGLLTFIAQGAGKVGVASATTQAAISLSALYADARYTLNSEESSARLYRLEPGVRVAQSHALAAQNFGNDLLAVARTADPERAAEARRLLELHARSLAATQRMFAAVDARDPATAQRIDRRSIAPLFATMQTLVGDRAVEQERLADTTFASFGARRRLAVRTATALTILALAAVIGFLFVIRAYHKRMLASHASEVRLIEEAALVDSLTNVGNHRAFKKDIQQELARAARYATPLTLAILDIDDFKMINDSSGHLQGDRVLLALAGVLRAGRAQDREYRLGGDEFALILPHTSARDASSILERIRSDVARATAGNTVSIGYATVEDAAISAEALRDRADAALYYTKRSGRNGVTQFDPSHLRG
jgi:diguanylate cyclase (GGDEF)-like protein